FIFAVTATTDIYTLSLHDALPILVGHFLGFESTGKTFEVLIQLGAILAILTVYSAKLLKILADFPRDARTRRFVFGILVAFLPRSEEHTSELQSRENLVCRLLLEK